MITTICCALALSGPAAEAAPEKPLVIEVKSEVEEHSLVSVRVADPAPPEYYDLSVLSVREGAIHYATVMPTRAAGSWVWTGPPGVYALRLTAANGKEFRISTATVTITSVGAASPRRGIAAQVRSLVSRHAPDGFPRAALAELYHEAAAGLRDGARSYSETSRYLSDEQDRIFSDADAYEWDTSIRPAIAAVWNSKVKGATTRRPAVEFYLAVARGLTGG